MGQGSAAPVGQEQSSLGSGPSHPSPSGPSPALQRPRPPLRFCTSFPPSLSLRGSPPGRVHPVLLPRHPLCHSAPPHRTVPSLPITPLIHRQRWLREETLDSEPKACSAAAPTLLASGLGLWPPSWQRAGLKSRWGPGRRQIPGQKPRAGRLSPVHAKALGRSLPSRDRRASWPPQTDHWVLLP